MYLTRADIDAMERRERAALINSVTGFKPANLVGTANGDGQTNLAILSSCVHIGSNPPLLALIFRPDSVERHTLDNIRATGHYTINHVNHGIIEAAHQTAASYPRDVSEFDATGLTPLWSSDFPAPFVEESLVCIGMRLREEIPLQVNGCHMVIGEIVSLDVPEDSIDATSALDLQKTTTSALAGLDSYYSVSLERRMAYAKPDQLPRRLDVD